MFNPFLGCFGCSAFGAKAVAFRIDCRGERLIILNLPWSKKCQDVEGTMTSLTLSVCPLFSQGKLQPPRPPPKRQAPCNCNCLEGPLQIVRIQIIEMSDISKVFPDSKMVQDGHRFSRNSYLSGACGVNPTLKLPFLRRSATRSLSQVKWPQS